MLGTTAWEDCIYGSVIGETGPQGSQISPPEVVEQSVRPLLGSKNPLEEEEQNCLSLQRGTEVFSAI